LPSNGVDSEFIISEISRPIYFNARVSWEPVEYVFTGGVVMEMKRINAGKLRAIGYDPRERTLRVELDDGSAIDYSGVGNEVWRRLSTSGSAWSYYRDNIEEEFSGRRGIARPQRTSNNPLDELFKANSDDAKP
jgi:hypothetical protein